MVGCGGWLLDFKVRLNLFCACNWFGSDFDSTLFFRTHTCHMRKGILPFESENPQDYYFEPFKDYFGKPLQSLTNSLYGDSMKIQCLERGNWILII